MTDRREEYDAVPDGEHLDPADAFALLGDPIRLDIVRVLFEAGRGNPVPFSDLFDRVDVDDTGRFNYHRDQLVPHFVRKSEDGYRLTQTGERVARAVNAGTYTESPEMDGFDVSGACYDCGEAALGGEYVGERFRVDCRACGQRVLNVGVPPSLARGRKPDAFVDAFQRWARIQVQQARKGLCPECGGRVEPGVSTPGRDTLDIDRQPVFDCTVCDRHLVTSFGALAFWHDEVASFFAARDRSPRDRPYWAVPAVMTDDHATLVSAAPFRYRITLRADGDACEVTFDDELAVTDLTVDADGGA